MQLTKSALLKTLPSKRRNRRFTRFSFALCLLLVVSLTPQIAHSNLKCTPDIKDTTPVEFLLAGENWNKATSLNQPVKMKIPKNYLVESTDWDGGYDTHITIGVDLSDNSASCIRHNHKLPYGDGTYSEGRYPSTNEKVVFVYIQPGRIKEGTDPIEQLITLDKKNYTILHQSLNGFAEYKYKFTDKLKEKTLLIPEDGLVPNKVHITCNSYLGKEDFKECTTYTYEKRLVRYSYHFRASKWLEKFPELDANIRKVISQFIVKE